MGIFNDADQHPFHEETEDVVVESLRGGLVPEVWDEDRLGEYVRPVYVDQEAA